MSQPASQAAAFIADQPTFNLRCQLIAMQFAVNVVFSEGSGVTDHANRLALALKIVNGQISPNLLARIVLTDTTIQAAAVADVLNLAAAVPDTGANSIDGRLQAMWNALADALV